MKTYLHKPGTKTNLLIILAAVTLLRLYYLSLGHFDLFFDEAQYWFWSREFAFGYYSKPPMVAWLIKATTAILGDSEFAIRISSPLIHMVTAIAIYHMADELYDRRVAVYGALAYITMPAVSLSSALVSTDPALLMFWSLSMLFFIKGVRKSAYKWWVLAGITAGLGMLSKYNMLLFLVSAVLYLALHKKHRTMLKSGRFWLACIIAFVVFLPNILWNFSNGFVSFLHTRDNAEGSGLTLNPLHMLEFIGAQFGIFGPIFFAVLLLILYKAVRHKSHDLEANKMMLCFILPMFLLIIAISMISRAHANWAAPVYVPATMLVIAYMVENRREKLIKLSLVINIIAALLFMNFNLITKIPGISFTDDKTNLAEGVIKDPFKRVHGWDEIGQAAAVLLAAYPGSVLLTDSRKLHSELLYYARPLAFNAVKWNADGKTDDHFDMTTDINKAGTDSFIIINQNPEKPGIESYFDSYEKVGNISIKPYGDYSMDYYAYYLKGFRGY